MKKLTLLSLLIPLLTSQAACMNLGSTAQEVSFYVLVSPADAPKASNPANQAKGPYVGIMPVILPSYLQRPQMVIREGNSVDISIEDYRRWGEDLPLGIARVVSQVMTNELTAIGGSAMPLRSGSPVDLRVRLDIRRFEGSPGGQVALEALWSIQRDGKSMRDGSFTSWGVSGPEISNLVQTQSELLYQLSTELSAAVRELWR